MQTTCSNLIRSSAALLGLALAITSGTVFGREKISVPNSTVSHDALDALVGFTPLTAFEIAAKFPRTAPPGYVVGNARRTTSIAYDLKPQPITDAGLEQGLKVFGRLMGGMVPNLIWKRKEIIEMAGQRWIFLEMTSSAIDTDIYNIMLITPFDGKMLIFNFVTTKEDFVTQEAALRASVASIHLT